MWGWKTFPIFDMKENPMGFALIQFILVLPIVYIERKYFINGFKRLIKRSPNMDSLICIGASFSLLYGLYALFMISWGVATNNASIVEQYHMSLYFESAGMILVFVSIGKYLESFSKRKTTKALENLIKETRSPIFMSSANLSGFPTCTNLEEIEKTFPNLDGLMEGDVFFGEASSIIDCTSETLKVLRQGPILIEQIIDVLEN